MSDLRCQNCFQPIQDRSEMAGRAVACPHCGFQFTMPMQSDKPDTPLLPSEPLQSPGSKYRKAKSETGLNWIPVAVGGGMVGLVALCGIVMTAVIWWSQSGDDEDRQLESLAADNRVWGNDDSSESGFPKRFNRPFDPSSQTGSQAAELARVKSLFAKDHQGENISQVHWHPAKHKYNVSCSYRDQEGNTVNHLFSANSNSDMNRKLAEFKRKPGFQLGKVYIVASTLTVTYRIDRDTGVRYGRDRYQASRPYSQMNDRIKFHGPPQWRLTGTRTSRQPLTPED